MKCVETVVKSSESITSLHEATARCRGVNHLLSLAFTLAPKERQDNHSVERTQSKLGIINKTLKEKKKKREEEKDTQDRNVLCASFNKAKVACTYLIKSEAL